jgi:PPOX class probable F420-dependent enzyme
MDIDEAREFIRANHRAVLATQRADGAVQMSPVLVAVDADGDIAVSTRETAMKTQHVRRSGRAAVCVLNDGFFGRWLQVEGPARAVSLPEAMELLVDYYRLVSGEHPDWDEYRAAMTRERRVVLKITPERAGPDRQG